MEVKRKILLVFFIIIILSLTNNSFKKPEKSLSLLIFQEKTKKVDRFLEEMMRETKKERIPVIMLLRKGKDEVKNSLISKFSYPKFKVRHYKIIPAISAKISKEELLRLKDNPQIIKIWYDRKVHALPVLPVKEKAGAKLINSRKLIDAESVWELGYTGKNVTVAIIDSGIDYTHPDLGGCFGEGCKVKGGYDFVNNDPDPKDDEGHGTHVAGIVGANGTIKGVAPGVTLLAVKVLDANGVGDTSDVIAGIDYAVKAGADIISLSLGSSRQPNDGFSIESLVADTAVELGKVVIVAAGNEGPGTGTVDIPGDAKKVITVGAADISRIPQFSCRGPSAFGRLDPEVVAPGVAITSTNLGGGYVTMTGTSMAAPHVAGAAALLLDYDNTLTPLQIRALLMHSSNNISGHEFEKGAGIINITRAITSKIRISINGDDRIEEEVFPGFNKSWEMDIQNKRNTSLNLTLKIGNLTNLENENSLGKELFSLPERTLIGANSNSSLKIKFSSPSTAKPGIYAGTIIVKVKNSLLDDEFRVPVVITIPIFGSLSLKGFVDNECSGWGCIEGLEPEGSITKWGDWLYYKLKPKKGTLAKVNLSWVNSSYDLDLYLLAANGELVNYSGAGEGNSEEITFPVRQDDYWVLVRAYSFPEKIPFTLNVSYTSGLNLVPDSFYLEIPKNQTRNFTLLLINDGQEKTNLSLKIKSLEKGDHDTWFFFGSPWNYLPGADLNGFYYIKKKWLSEMNLNLSLTKYATLNLTWNSAYNLDLYLKYKKNGSIYPTRFSSEHDNNQLGKYWEKIERVDIRYYLDNYDDLGIIVANKNTSDFYDNFTVTVELEDMKEQNHLTINPSLISFFGNFSRENLTLRINSSLLTENQTYDFLLTIENRSQEIVFFPIRIKVNPPQSSSTSTTTSTSTSTSSTIITNTTTSTTSTSTSTSTTSTTTTTTIGVGRGDINHDGEVGLLDLAMLGQAWQTSEGDVNWNPEADLNSDGKIDLIDLAILGQNWGNQY